MRFRFTGEIDVPDGETIDSVLPNSVDVLDVKKAHRELVRLIFSWTTDEDGEHLEVTERAQFSDGLVEQYSGPAGWLEGYAVELKRKIEAAWNG